MTTLADQTGTRAPAPATVFLPYTPASATAARRMVVTKLKEWGLESLVDDAALIVTELAANAAKTCCRRRMGVKIRRTGERSVRIAVRDGSRVLPVLIDAGPDATSGRGIALVHALTEGRWGAKPEPLGKTVHADLQT
ncbi:hypothetical protein CFP65_4554 [Kitasatospora sp. MMS16-BH015]|uniref:ATP-binding protein n=1 Tax=Kitasatospora sp. MMS16-BH015 TaxID=2018025 RepID=UPI000CA3A3B2|nr:ATP-binding protein [Kitasatospora sp. MMS16-BH015]AUG79298.1 hypothetical protein CFP65_4554 [Kitasatospora sp. MMS16-BH015]